MPTSLAPFPHAPACTQSAGPRSSALGTIDKAHTRVAETLAGVVPNPSATRLRGGSPSEKPLLTERQVVRALIDQYNRQIEEDSVKNGLVKTTCGHWIHSSRLPDGSTRIMAENARGFWKPSLNDYKDKTKRTPDSLPALFYRQVTGEDWDGENQSYDRAAKTYNRLWGRDREYEQERAQQRKLLRRKRGGASGSSAVKTTSTVATRDGAPDTSTVATTLRGVAQPSAHGTNGASGGALGIVPSTSNVANAPRATGGPAVAPPSAHGPSGASSSIVSMDSMVGKVPATCSVANVPREPAVPLPHAHGTGGASGVALGSGSLTVATAPKPRREEERFDGDYEAYRRADKAWHEKRRRDRLKSSAPYSTGARATSFIASSNITASASMSSRAATAAASPLPSNQPTAQLLSALPLPDPFSLLPPIPREPWAAEHEQRRAIEAAELAERLATEREVAATAHLEEWLIAEWERVSGELQQVRAAQLQQWREAQSQLRPTRIVTDDDEAPNEMVSMCCAGDDHSEDEGEQNVSATAASATTSGCGVHASNMQFAALERRLLDVERELTQLRRQRSRDDEALVDGLQQRLQEQSGAKRPIKEEYVKAAAALARDPAFARDPKLKKEDSWWASFPVPAGKSRTDARKNASTILEKGWLDELCGQPAPATAAAPLNASVILQLENEEGERFGPQLDVPIDATSVKLQQLLSRVLSDHALQDCAFRVLGGSDVTATLGEALQSVSTERSVRLVYTVPAVEKTDAYCERLGFERITLENAAEYPPPKLWDFKPATRSMVDSPPAIWYWRMTGGNWSDSERSLSHEYHIVADRWRRLLDEHHERDARRDRLRKIEDEATRACELHREAQDGPYRDNAERMQWVKQRMVKAIARKKRADCWALLHELAADAGRRLGRSQAVELLDGNAFDRYVGRTEKCRGFWYEKARRMGLLRTRDQPRALSPPSLPSYKPLGPIAAMLEAPAAQLVADLAQCLVCHLTFKHEHPGRVPSASSATADVNELSAAFIEFELRRDAQSGMLFYDEAIALLDACDSWLNANGDEDSPHESDLWDRSNRLTELGCHWHDPTTRSEALETSLTVEDGYVGEEKDGVPEGRGAMRSANGDVYVGQWQAGKPHGLGTMCYGRGLVFDGEWSEGERVPVWSQARSACHVGSWAVPALASGWISQQQQQHVVGFSDAQRNVDVMPLVMRLEVDEMMKAQQEQQDQEQEAREQKAREETEAIDKRCAADRARRHALQPRSDSPIREALAAAKEAYVRESGMRVTDEEAAILSEEQRCAERGESGPLKAEAFDVVSRLCDANHVTDCPKHDERLRRLLSIKEHGRPDPCKRCGATLMCSFTPEGEPTELFCIGRVCHRRTQDDGYIGGRRQIKQWWEWEDCGWERKITPENKAQLLCRPLVDSKARDLCKVVQAQKAPSCPASASASAPLSLGLGSGRWSASALSCAQDASTCPAEADTAPTTCAAPPGAPSSPTPPTPRSLPCSPSRERVGEVEGVPGGLEEGEAGGVEEGKQDSSDSENIEICDEPPDDNDVAEMHEYFLPMD